ncbi:hypothetical protein GEMRC1_013555 [Eukaryota sp. GEM-RC1]
MLLWPHNLPNDCYRKCGQLVTLSHTFPCSHYITYRSAIHDPVHDQLHVMCKSYKIESFIEPLLRSLDINQHSKKENSYGQRRADLIIPSSSESLTVIDVVSVDVCKKSCNKFVTKEISPLDIAENIKQRKYADPLKNLKHIVHVDYSLVPFAISISGRLGKLALKFLDEFAKVVARRTNKTFDRSFGRTELSLRF